MENTLGRRIRKIRELVGVSQVELAKKIGVTPKTFRVYENDETGEKTTLYSLEKIADALSINILWLVSGRGTIRKNSSQENYSSCDTFGQRLEKIRESLGMNKSEFGFALDVPAASFTRYENNSVKPGLDLFERICNADQKMGLDLNLNWLIGGYGEMKLEEDQTKTQLFNNIPYATQTLLSTALGLTEQEGYSELDKILFGYTLGAALKKQVQFPQTVSLIQSLYFSWGSLERLKALAEDLSNQMSFSQPTIDSARETIRAAIEHREKDFNSSAEFSMERKGNALLAPCIISNLTDVECLVILHDIEFVTDTLASM